MDAMQVSDEAASVLRQLLFSNIRRRVVVVRAQGPSPGKAGSMKLKRGPESSEPAQKVWCTWRCQEIPECCKYHHCILACCELQKDVKLRPGLSCACVLPAEEAQR